MILVKGLSKRYEEVQALRDISFEVRSAESLVILGPSGSGKTTLLRLIAGLELPDQGEIHMDGSLVSKRGWALPPHRREVGFVFQSPALWPHMTVMQNILFGLNGVGRREGRRRLQEMLELTSLAGLEHRYPREISGGEARRVAIARALTPRPKRLLMDEPLINLDPELREKMLFLVLKTARENACSLVYVTHDPEEARRISGSLLILKEGVTLGEEKTDDSAARCPGR